MLRLAPGCARHAGVTAALACPLWATVGRRWVSQPKPPAAEEVPEEDFGIELPGERKASAARGAPSGRARPADPVKERSSAGLNTFFDDGSSRDQKPRPVVPSAFKKQWQQPVKVRPGSGAHHRDTVRVPDRLRDALTYFGTDAHKHATDETSSMPKESRDSMLRNLMGSNTNMYSHASIDKVRLSLEGARRKPHDSEEWRVVWSFLRTMHFMCELVREPYDTFPEGDKLYIDLESCKDRRRPYFLRLEDGTVVLPVFSGEYYVGIFFQRLQIFESQWFPTPRMGKLWEGYAKQDFPVLAHGGLHHMASLATVATPHQVLLCINPMQPECKFLTYPEMVTLGEAAKKHTEKVKPQSSVESSLNPNRGGIHERVAISKDRAAFDYSPALHRIFDSSKWAGKRFDPVHLPPPDPRAYEGGIVVPAIAADEMKILIFDVLELERVYLADRPPTDASGGKRTRAAVAVMSGREDFLRKGDLVRQRVSEWSYLKESEIDMKVEVVSAAPTEPEGTETNEIYNADNTALLRDSLVHVRSTIREQLGYDDVL